MIDRLQQRVLLANVRRSNHRSFAVTIITFTATTADAAPNYKTLLIFAVVEW